MYMNKIILKIRDAGKTSTTEVQATPYIYKDVELFTHKDNDGWHISELTTGMSLDYNHFTSEKKALERAKYIIDDVQADKIKDIVNYQVCQWGACNMPYMLSVKQLG